jgi:hypothetical protein
MEQSQEQIGRDVTERERERERWRQKRGKKYTSPAPLCQEIGTRTGGKSGHGKCGRHERFWDTANLL